MNCAQKNFIKLIETPWICVTLLFGCVGYTCWYLGFGDPTTASGALSTIGLRHPLLFSIWGVLTACALLLNIARMYWRFRYKNRYSIYLLGLGLVSMAITLLVPFNAHNMFQYLLHCYGAISYIIYNAVAMIILFVKFYRKPSLLFLAGLTTTVLLTTLGLFLVLGESGILEVVPMAFSFIVLLFVNETKLIQPHTAKAERSDDATEIAQTEEELVTQ